MRAVITNGVGILSPQGFLDGTNAPTYLTLSDVNNLRNINANMLLLSLKSVVFFNKNGLDIFIKVLLDVHDRKKIPVGIVDYNKVKYDTIIRYYGASLRFSLFSNQKIAGLFANKTKDDSLNVLLYHKDPSQRSAMAIELYNHGHNPVIAQNKEEYETKKRAKKSYDIIIDSSELGTSSNTISSRVSGNAVIYTLNNFLDASVQDSFDIIYHTNSLNVGFRLFLFDSFNVTSMNIHGLNFFTMLSNAGAEYDATFAIIGMDFNKIPINFKNDLEDAGLMFFESMEDILGNKTLLHELGGASAGTAKKSKRMITKPIIGELPKFIEATVSTMEMMTNSIAVKKSVNLNSLQLEEGSDSIASSIGFYGQMDGMIILIFPKSIAQKACELLLGEENADMDVLLDALAEFGNIIAGRVKVLMQEGGLSVDITLPRTYDNVESILDVVGDKKGVQVEMTFADDQFTFFLTR
ncbi:MAG: chemotaxis protein CheX [Helicobacteraceae bacterium]|nr:chemotaxis protein CheX [Helicobacteraceae bacterium]